MDNFLTIQQIDRSTDTVRNRISISPRVGIILGSGLGGLADKVEESVSIPVSEIPNWPISTVAGHKGRLVIGKLSGIPVMVLQGRVHYYEGYSMAEVTLPVRVMQRLGVNYLVVTNAAGAINPQFQPGDVMLITDQLNLAGMAGLNPLHGPNLFEFGERFPDMSQAYDRQLLDMARASAKNSGITLHEGVYVGLAGPSFETPADLRFLRLAGADAVGMSTVSEVIVARHGGTRVLGLSGISNKANLDGGTVTTHEEVLAAGNIILPKLTQLVLGFLAQLHDRNRN